MNAPDAQLSCAADTEGDAEVCDECGNAYDLCASDGARMCVSCATPDEVREFLEGSG